MAEALTALGLMSGTSMDGIDLAVIRTDGESVQQLGPALTVAYDREFRDRLVAAVQQPDRLGIEQRTALEQQLTTAHAEAITDFFQRFDIDRESIDVIGFHGHTLVHRPAQGVSVQLGDGTQLARQTGIDVVNDLRSADVRAGGQGAPLAPLYHAALARGLEQPLAVLNLGGVGNLTLIDGDTLIAFDTGPGNAMLDDWIQLHTDKLFDQDGQISAAGQVDARVLAQLLDHPFFRLPPPKSLDRNAFSAEPLRGLSLQDGAATLLAFTAAGVTNAVAHLPRPPLYWLVTGGGRHNPTLMAEIRRRLLVPVAAVESVGWCGDVLEAQAFGFLAVRSLYGLPLSLPTTTGVPYPVSGGVLHQVVRV